MAFAPDGRFAYSGCGQIRSLGASLRRSTIRVVGDDGGPTWGAEALAFSETVSNPSDSSVLVVSSKLLCQRMENTPAFSSTVACKRRPLSGLLPLVERCWPPSGRTSS